MRRLLALALLVALAGCNPCRQAQARLCKAEKDRAAICPALETLVEAGEDDASCKLLLDADKARDLGQPNAEIAYTSAQAAVLAAAAKLQLKKAQQKVQEAFSK